MTERGGLCETCKSPGACCKRMFLNGGPGPFHMHEPMSRENAEHAAHRLDIPFLPSHQKEDGTWEWSCTQLLDNGRCGIYEERPNVCRIYEAGSSPLCIHYWDLESNDDSDRKS